MLAEAGQTMEGSIERAMEMARSAADAGCWGFKTQLLQPEKIAAPGAQKYWEDDFGTADQREAFAAAGVIDYGAWREVAQECKTLGLKFVATPFDLEAVQVLAPYVDLFKIASGDITFRRLIEAVAAHEKPVLLSTGASEADEVGRAYETFEQAGCPTVLLACSLVYPCPVEEANLARIGHLKALSGGEVGYSDHTLGMVTSVAAAAAGAVVCEKHYTYAGRHHGQVADHAMALDPEGMAEYVGWAHYGAQLRGRPHLTVTPSEGKAKIGARRAVRAARNLPVGHVLREEDLIELRPYNPGRPSDPWRWGQLVGRELAAPVAEGEPFILCHVPAPPPEEITIECEPEELEIVHPETGVRI